MRLVTVQAQPGDTYRSLAAKFLGDEGRFGELAALNRPDGADVGVVAPLVPGRIVVLPET
jgi:cytochrome c551/c552